MCNFFLGASLGLYHSGQTCIGKSCALPALTCEVQFRVAVDKEIHANAACRRFSRLMEVLSRSRPQPVAGLREATSECVAATDISSKVKHRQDSFGTLQAATLRKVSSLIMAAAAACSPRLQPGLKRASLLVARRRMQPLRGTYEFDPGRQPGAGLRGLRLQPQNACVRSALERVLSAQPCACAGPSKGTQLVQLFSPSDSKMHAGSDCCDGLVSEEFANQGAQSSPREPASPKRKKEIKADLSGQLHLQYTTLQQLSGSVSTTGTFYKVI